MEINPHTIDAADLKNELVERGLDPDGTVSAVKGMVADYVKSQRLSWKEAAMKKRSEMMETTRKLVSWATRGSDEVHAAFAKLQSGSNGAVPRTELQVAFRNLSGLSLEEKARILDEVDGLSEIARQKSDSGENP